jgi:hypothetical protein
MGLVTSFNSSYFIPTDNKQSIALTLSSNKHSYNDSSYTRFLLISVFRLVPGICIVPS